MSRRQHPGYAVKFSNGSWLCVAHGISAVEDAFYARIYQTKKGAENDVLVALQDGDIPDSCKSYEIVDAWEPLCESLRVKIASLEAANKISPSDIMDMTFSLESVLSQLKKSL